jgi:protein tyrosine kinase modulator
MGIMRPRGLFEYLGILWRKKLLIILVAASVSIATYQIIRRIPNVYESHALIVIANQGNGNNDPALSSPPLSALTQRMTSQGNLTEIVRRYDLYPQTPGAPPNPGATVERLRKAIKIEVKMRNYYPDGPESLTISYRYTDSVIAQRVVADLISIFDQTNAAIRLQAATDLERFQAQLAEIKTQLQGLTPQRDQALFRSGSLNNAPAVVRAQRLAAADSVGALGDKEFMLARQIDAQKRQIAEQEKLVSSAAPASRLATNSAYGVLLARRAEVEGQLKDLASSATEKNPKMIQAKSQLASINQEIARLEAASGANSGAAGNSSSPEALELRAMRRELQRLENEQEVARRDLSRKTEGLKELPQEQPNAGPAEIASTVRLNEAKAEYDRLMGRYNWVMDRQDSLQKLFGNDGRKGEVFQVVDAPLAQPAPVLPNRRLLMLIGLGIALALGLVIASAWEIPRLFLIRSDHDVEYYLGTPVLAVIPETFTPSQRSRRRVLWGLRWMGLALLLGAMIPVFVIVIDRAQIFQILANR